MKHPEFLFLFLFLFFFDASDTAAVKVLMIILFIYQFLLNGFLLKGLEKTINLAVDNRFQQMQVNKSIFYFHYPTAVGNGSIVFGRKFRYLFSA